MNKERIFKLKGKTLVIIDWANVYGWFDKNIDKNIPADNLPGVMLIV